ncbi:hypothetical protein SLS58_006129 [Diplodia intermedia]|uniref:Uncharacterized protein n=1 Tax=Diplodia intermedia TaxID=856260 RepID=A0ABR3TPF5_9PEZI
MTSFAVGPYIKYLNREVSRSGSATLSGNTNSNSNSNNSSIGGGAPPPRNEKPKIYSEAALERWTKSNEVTRSLIASNKELRKEMDKLKKEGVDEELEELQNQLDVEKRFNNMTLEEK